MAYVPATHGRNPASWDGQRSENLLVSRCHPPEPLTHPSGPCGGSALGMLAEPGFSLNGSGYLQGSNWRRLLQSCSTCSPVGRQPVFKFTIKLFRSPSLPSWQSPGQASDVNLEIARFLEGPQHQ